MSSDHCYHCWSLSQIWLLSSVLELQVVPDGLGHVELLQPAPLDARLSHLLADGAATQVHQR